MESLLERRLIGCLRIWLHRATTPPERDAAMAAAIRILKARNIDWNGPPCREPLIGIWRATCAAVASRPDHMLHLWERRCAVGVFEALSARVLGRR